VSSPTAEPTAGYWYDDQAVMEVLAALRRFRRADELVRRRLSDDMHVNPLDLRALQLVVAAGRRSRPLSPGELSHELGVSTAATTKLVDRLVASDHVARTPHEHDRRSVVLHATDHAHETLRRRMGRLHERMAETAAAVPVESRHLLVEFLDAMADVMDAEPADGASAPTR
jgi:DNA-binding MarR family transcriptional regulator